MREYAVRRAYKVKNYKRVVLEAGLGEQAYEWLCKFARGEIPKSSADRVEKLCRYYKLLEARERRQVA